MSLIFGLLVLVPLGHVVWLLIYAAREHNAQRGTCSRCGYDLRQLGNRRECPECGHPFVITDTGEVISRA